MEMKKITISMILTFLMLPGCGGEPESPADAFTAMPDDAMMAFAIVDPVALITNIDGYIDEGMPALGSCFIENTLCSKLSVDDIEALMTQWGLDPNGTILFFMEAMAPATMGFAANTVDSEVFFTHMSDLGLTFTDADPLDNIAVKSTTIPTGNLFFAEHRSVLLAAGSRGTLSSMVERLDSGVNRDVYELAPGMLWSRMELSAMGPMAAAQLAMVRPQIIAEMTAEGPDNEMGVRMIGLYFDAISIFLNQTETVETSLQFGPGDIEGTAYIRFTPGSDLAALISSPVEVVDLTGLIPAGDVAMARISVPPEVTKAILSAVTEAMGVDFQEESLDFYADYSRNSAMSIMLDDAGSFMHLVAVYQLPEGSGLEEVRGFYELQLDFTTDIMGESAGMVDFDLTETVYNDRTYLLFDMNLDFSSMEIDGADIPETGFPEDMSFTTWITVDDELLFIEMADTPIVLDEILSGTLERPTADSAPVFADAGSADFVMAFNLNAYIRMIMVFAGEEIDLSSLPETPVWLNCWAIVDADEAMLIKHGSVSGAALVSLIGSFAMMF
jgi:hypothetical protein